MRKAVDWFADQVVDLLQGIRPSTEPTNSTASSHRMRSPSGSNTRQPGHQRSRSQHPSVRKMATNHESSHREDARKAAQTALQNEPRSLSNNRTSLEDANYLKKRNEEFEDAKKELEYANEKLNDHASYIEKLEHEYHAVKSENKALHIKNEDAKLRDGNLKQKLDTLYRFCNDVVKNYAQPYAAKKNMQYDLGSIEKIYGFLAYIFNDALEAAPLRAQVQSLEAQIQALQKDMLAKVDKTQSVPDEQFRRDFGNLASAIKTFSRSIKLSPDINIADIGMIHGCVLVAQVPEKYWDTGLRKKAMMEAIVWSVLIHFIFNTPFSMFGPIFSDLSDTFSSLFGPLHSHGWPIPTDIAERWRYTTLERLLELTGVDMITNGPSEDHNLARSMHSVRYNIHDVVESTFLRLSPNTDYSKLKVIVDKAMGLALQMFLERSRVQIVWPALGDPFVVGETPHLASTHESEDVEEGYVAFIVNPGLAKWGDAHGKNLETRLDIVPAQVFVEPFIGDVVTVETQMNVEDSVSCMNNGVDLSPEDRIPDTRMPGLDAPPKRRRIQVAIPYIKELDPRTQDSHTTAQGSSAEQLQGIDMNLEYERHGEATSYR
ncbi:hypothetical protein P280DRAFT_548005 [Massarina eburnea CBS 473.64]|uniref:Uncharacterized protein n=1 Tax=Massarina eburnea CBS 473.64 TaxID=1395130 RepID=A0A6A6S8M5_9PLEO|nr:hypothetical protein P280DRAFT_548005 [Massarina eburnea CBS 473.64]